MSNKETLVSIVIPAYNVEAYIIECIESVQKQTYQNLEIIVVNDGSTDGTAAYCDKMAALDSRIRVLHRKNAGVVVARGVGVDISQGKFLSFVDGDDWIEPGMIEGMVKQMGEADMVSCGVYREQFPGNVIERVDKFVPGVYRDESALSYIYRKMIYDQELDDIQPMTPWIVNKLYINNKVKRIYGEIKKNITFAEDSMFLYKYMLEECKSIVICETCFYHYRYRNDSAVHTLNEHVLKDINNVYLSLKELFQKHRQSQELLYQLQKWITTITFIAVSERMGFDKRIHIPEFVADLKGVAFGKLILYGAGKVGRDTYRQLMEFGYDVLLWVDKGYQYYRKVGLDVESPEEIARYNYDTIVIAVENETIADEIKKELLKKGIAEDSVIWKKPMKLY